MKKYMILFLVTFLIAGCSREGFEDSLNKRENGGESEPPTISEESSKSQEVSLEDLIITMEPKEIVDDHRYIVYSVPVMDGVNDAAAKIIGEKIETIMTEVSSSFDLSIEDSMLEIYDAVGIITDEVVSVYYEGSYSHKDLAEPSQFAFGLNFSASTGGQHTVSDFMKPHTLASLIIDEQSSQIEGKEEHVLRKREEISQKGMSSLADRIVAADSQRDVDNLLAFSFYVEKGKLIAIIPMDADDLSPAYVAVNCDKT